MFSYIWPLAIIVFSNVLYQVCAKGIPQTMNTYASMTVTYAVATLFSLAAFFITSKGGIFVKEFGQTNWATVALGVFAYHESIDWNKILGVLICLVGLWFINK